MYCFPGKVMVNAVNLRFAKERGKGPVDGARGCRVFSKRFLNKDARPTFLRGAGVRNAAFGKPGNNGEIERRGRGKVKEDVWALVPR